MLKFIRIPLLFLFIASLIGVFLRWQFISPTPGINYTFFLHGHSHIMFIGWVFNALYIAFTINHIPKSNHKRFKVVFIIMQLLVVGMMISFPIQGYGLYSIAFSTLHTLLAIYFVIVFIRETNGSKMISVWYACTSLLFFALSSIGPFALGFMMSKGMGQSEGYYLSIYYYLHFQYNGFFIFGIISLLFRFLEQKEIKFDEKKAKTAGVLLAASCVPLYLLSTLWTDPGILFNLIGGVAALIHIFASLLLITLLKDKHRSIRQCVSISSQSFFAIVAVSFMVKIVLQLLSSVPYFAQMSYQFRPIVIGYLHLVLLGVVTLFLLIWYIELNFADRRPGNKALILFLFSFAGMEACLIVTPWWGSFPGYIFVFSVMVSISIFMIYYSSFIKIKETNYLDR